VVEYTVILLYSTVVELTVILYKSSVVEFLNMV